MDEKDKAVVSKEYPICQKKEHTIKRNSNVEGDGGWANHVQPYFERQTSKEDGNVSEP